MKRVKGALGYIGSIGPAESLRPAAYEDPVTIFQVLNDNFPSRKNSGFEDVYLFCGFLSWDLSLLELLLIDLSNQVWKIFLLGNVKVRFL